MLKKIKNTFIYFLARMLMGLVRMMKFERSLRFGRWLGRRAYKWAKKERYKTLQHLEWAFPEKSVVQREKLARNVFEHFGQAVAEVVNVAKIKDLADYVDFEEGSREILADSLSKGRGVVYVTGHVGNWELMARSLARYGFPVNTIGQKSYDPRFTRLMQRFRDEGSVKTIWRGDPQILEKMAAVLKRGEIMGLLFDQDTKVPGVFVPFFGKPAYTPLAAASLAHNTKAVTVIGLNYRRPNGGLRIAIKPFEA
ncbi:MAG: lipid A biosynthesis acyltransferase, partial [Deltaproteobacteria bacterium]|nr:lipid A biosynthesis acyltransferase [Deltaproteobacteria bacterium]